VSASSALTDGERAGIALGVLLAAGMGGAFCVNCYARAKQGKQFAISSRGIPTLPTDSAVMTKNSLAEARAALSAALGAPV
jgi:hypothetical protein